MLVLGVKRNNTRSIRTLIYFLRSCEVSTNDHRRKLRIMNQKNCAIQPPALRSVQLNCLGERNNESTNGQKEIFLFNGSSVCSSLSDDIAIKGHGGLIEIRCATRLKRYKKEWKPSRRQSSDWPDDHIRESTKDANTTDNFNCILSPNSATPRSLA